MIDWKVSHCLIPYPDALSDMQSRVASIRAGTASEQVWLLEHPPCYTAGSSAKTADLIQPDLLPIYETGRGGQYTYHGPGQRIAYAMLDLAARKIDIRQYVSKLQCWILAVLQEFNVEGECPKDRIGVWVSHQGKEKKIAALGVRVSRGVAYHGISLNVSPDLGHYRGIVPCGISQYGVTSLAEMGIKTDMAQIDVLLQKHFGKIFS